MGILAFIGAFVASFLGIGQSQAPTLDYSSQFYEPQTVLESEDWCKAEVEPSVIVRVDVDSSKEYFPPPDDNKPLYLNKESKDWILIKRHAGLPAWKIESGYGHCRFPDPDKKIPKNIPKGKQRVDYCRAHKGEWIYETEKIGKTVDEGKDVYVGLGHCSGNPGETCSDPLVADTIFVLEEKGRDWSEVAREEVCRPWPKPKSKECSQVPGFWWDFSVYIVREAFLDPESPSNSGLPCWTKLACAGDIATDGGERRQEACAGGANIFSQGKNSKSEELSAESFGEGFAILALPASSPTPTPISILKKGGSLKLGTFYPVIEHKKFAYEWWTPACKPAIYLYPNRQMRINVKVDVKGKLTRTIPEYPEGGWEVVAYPDGSIKSDASGGSVALKPYPYLFYEAKIERLKVPKEGWVVAQEELPDFFDKVLGKLGLIEGEIRDFKQYWVAELTKSPYYFVGLVAQEELDRVEKIKFSQRPDTFIRVRFVFEELAAPISIQPPKLPNFQQRKGFTAIDWGGVLLDGSCQAGLVN